jgi:hypothetical protein
MDQENYEFIADYGNVSPDVWCKRHDENLGIAYTYKQATDLITAHEEKMHNEST